MNCLRIARHVAEARCDGAEMRRAGGEVDMRRQLVLDDRDNHGAVLLGSPGRPGGAERCLSLHLAGLNDMDGLGQVTGLPGAAAKLAQDAPGLELGAGAFAGAAEPGVSTAGVLLRGG